MTLWRWLKTNQSATCQCCGNYIPTGESRLGQKQRRRWRTFCTDCAPIAHQRKHDNDL